MLDAAVVGEAEGHIRPRQRHAPEDFVAVGIFGRLLLEKFASRRGIEVEVGGLDDRAAAQGRWRQREIGGVDAPAVGGIYGATGQGQARHRGDRGQRLAAEAVGGDAFEIDQAGDLAGGMPRQGERKFGLGDAAAVVGDADRAYASLHEFHVDLARAGIEAVLDQLLEYGGRAFDHFASGDLADE